MWRLAGAGEGSAAAAGKTQGSNDGAVGARLGVLATQSVFFHLCNQKNL